MSKGLERRVEALERANEPPEESLAEAISRARMEADLGLPHVWREHLGDDPISVHLRRWHAMDVEKARAEGREIHFVKTQAEADRLCQSLPAVPGRPHLVVIQPRPSFCEAPNVR